MRLVDTDLDIRASHDTFDNESGFTQEHAGVPVWKTVDDMDRYRRVIGATSPDVIVEAGTRWGGFAAWLADTFDVEVVTIDVDTEVEGRPESWPGVTFVAGSTIDPAVTTGVARLVDGRRTMVTLDSDHHAPHVEAEIRAYGPMVSAGCYLVVEDGLADLVGREESRRFGSQIPSRGGPLKAIARSLIGNPAWQRDEATENLTPVSHHPAGWWIRRG